MAEYIKQEMTDLNYTGEQKCFYRLKTNQNISTKELIRRMTAHGSSLNRGEILNVIITLTTQLAEELAQGNSVTIDGLGCFKATIGLVEDKEQDTIDGDEPKHNSRSLQIDGVNYRADKGLVKSVSKQCHLTRGGTNRLHQSKYTLDERLALALDYLTENHAMHIDDYVTLTGLSKTTASLELKKLAADETSGISAIGRGAGKVYVKK